MMAGTASPLHVEVLGQGAPVVMLHGWGMHSGLLRPLAEHLAATRSVALVDLPGHGESRGFVQFADLASHVDYLVTQLAPLLEQGVTLIGWSLGGLLAQAMALQYPQYIRRLILLCSTPCFVQRPDWTCALEAQVLQRFAAGLEHDAQATLTRFLALQFMAAQNPKENLRQGRALLFNRPQPQVGALQQGLYLLEHTDLRARVASITCPSLVINAEHDTLVPPAAGQFLAEAIPAGRGVLIKDAGHAPFLSHSERVNYFLGRFMHAN